MRSKIVFLSFISIAVGICGCEKNTDEPATEKVLKSGIGIPLEHFDWNLFYAEKNAWETQQSDHYQFTARALLNIPTSVVQITIVSDTEPAITVLYHADVDFFYGTTISEIYRSIETILKQQSEEKTDAIKIIITYNNEYHYPEYFLKYSDSDQSAGGEIGMEITDFALLAESTP